MRLPEGFDRFRIASVASNLVFKIPVEDRTIFLKIYTPKQPRLKTAWRQLLGSAGLRQPVEYRSPKERQTFEKATIEHWRSFGASVPAIADPHFPELSACPFLATEFIEGPTLRELLRDDSLDDDAKAEKVAILFSEMEERHRLAFRMMDNRLFHIDANTRNILFRDRKVFHIDFEMGRPWESVIQCASREVLKCLVTMMEDTRPSSRKSLANLFRNCYQRDDVCQFIVKEITGRPFQRIHRIRNARKEQSHPEKVTLYNILGLFFA